MSEFLDFSPYLRALLATCFVALLAGFAIFVYKKRFDQSRNDQNSIKVVSRFRLDQKSSLILVEVKGIEVLVGLTSGGIAVSRLSETKLTPEFKNTLEEEIEKSRDGNTL